jgi:hypothetical protein
MQEQIQIKVANYPKMIGQLIHSNQFLKVFATITMLIALGLVILLFSFMTKAPTVIPLTEDAVELRLSAMPKPEMEVKRAINAYLELRYQWTPQSVRQNLEKARAFISPQSLRAYQTATANLVEFSTQKVVTQKVFPGTTEVSVEKGLVVVSGDRITSIQGLKAAGNLNLELSFESGPRTKENPWGVYITREKESL